MDWVGFTTYSAADLIARERRGSLNKAEIEQRNTLYVDSYRNWFQGIYRDKYYYMGDWELMRLAFRLDLGLYYLGVVTTPITYGPESFSKPPLSGAYTTFPVWLTRTYNRRLAAIARRRLRRGTWGRKNDRRYDPFVSFSLDYSLHLRVLANLLGWFWLEVKEALGAGFTARGLTNRDS